MKKTLIALCALCFGMTAFAQHEFGNTWEEDSNRIALEPVLFSNTSVPENAQPLLISRLQQIVTKNGLGSNSLSPRFVVTANVIETDKDISTTVPTIYSVSMDVYMYVGDMETGNLFSSCYLGSVKGVGKSDNQAYMNAIKRIQPNNPEAAKCIAEGTSKIVNYYNTEIDLLVSNAMALADQGNYMEGIAVLMDVPSICTAAYKKALENVSIIYQKKIDVEGAEFLAKAKATWSANVSYNGAVAAAEYLGQVHPNSSSAAEAERLNQQIAARLLEIDGRQWEFKLKKQQDRQDIFMGIIGTVKDVFGGNLGAGVAKKRKSRWF